MKRREFLRAAALAGAWPLLGASQQPSPPWVASGDCSPHRVILCSRAPGPARMQVEWSLRRDFRNPHAVLGPRAGPETDFTAQLELRRLPAAHTIHYRVGWQGQPGAPVAGQFKTPPAIPGTPIRLVWGADVVGQGWGIDPAHGGLLTFQSMAEARPDFFLHCGDSIYADNPVPASIVLDDGSLWRNRVTPEKSRVAQTLDDFRGNHRYNLLDPHYRNFLAQVPVIAQWDDHEVCDNWWPGVASPLAALSLRAFTEYWPITKIYHQGRRRIYRQIAYGPDLDLFALDLRSYRGPNSLNRQTEAGPATSMMGREQLNWLKASLLQSRATWKVIGGEMPIATFSPQYGLDNWANGVGPPLGREFELAELLAFLKHHSITNVVWLSADVHYAAAVQFDPGRASFRDFLPFWEFIAGPLHAGTFAPNGPVDPTFGAEQTFCAVPADLKPNRPPSQGLQFFGMVEVVGRQLTVTFHDRAGRELHRQRLPAV